MLPPEPRAVAVVHLLDGQGMLLVLLGAAGLFQGGLSLGKLLGFRRLNP